MAAEEDVEEAPQPEHSWLESLDGVELGDTWAQRLFKVLVPFAIPAAVYAFLYTVLAYTRWLQLGALAVSYLFPPLGKESIIPIGVGYGFTVWQMTGLIFMADVVCSMFISWNLPLAKKIPLIGRLISWIERKGSRILEENPSLKAVSWVGLVLFVMVPFQGSGGITASIIGRAIGMRASFVITAVGVGALFAGLLIGTAAEAGWEAIRADLVSGVILVMLGILVALTVFLVYRLYKIRKWEAMDRRG